MNIEIIEISCCECNISFWITKKHNIELLRCHNTFHCPNGHPQNYTGKTEAVKAKEERDMYKQWYKSQQETSKRLARSNSSLRGVITRNKNK